MKKFLQLCCWVLLAGCNGRSAGKKNILENLTGVYVNESISAYSKAIDTLSIAKEGSDAPVFLITRHVVFQRIRKGKTGIKEYELEKWVAVYHENTGELIETKKGRVLTYNANEQKIYLGNTGYKKLR